LAHSFDTSLRITGSSSPVTANYTCGTGATVLVLAIITGGSTARAGGAPTYNGVAMTEVYSGIKAASSPETNVDMYYLLNPPTGSAYQISIPNTGSKSLFCMASSYKAASGNTSALDVKNNATETSTNPTCSVTTTADAVLIACVGNGANTWAPTGRTGTQLGDYDDGNYGDGHQYYIKTGAGSQAMAWTFGTSEDWAEIVVAFKEVTAYSLSIGSGSFSETEPVNPNLLKASKIIIDPSSYAETGQIVNLLKGYKTVVDLGTFMETGQDVTLIYANVKKITTDSGTYEEVGNPLLQLKHHKRILCGSPR
jgi:hypothetical protein